MPPAPSVQSLSDIVAQVRAAQAPEQAQIDQSVANNEQSGSAQTAGLDQAKTNAFGGIEQAASNKGMYFSGFAPNQEATYTGSTYLPALAKLQQTIAATRNSLLGQKANLATQANTQALNTQENQQKELDSYNSQQTSIKAAADLEARREAAAAAVAAQNNAARVSAAANRAPSMAATKQNDIGTISQALQGVAGHDGFVSPQAFTQARQEWTNAGYSADEFNKTFRNYANLTYGDTSYNNYGLKK